MRTRVLMLVTSVLMVAAGVAQAAETDWFGRGASGRWQDWLGGQEIGGKRADVSSSSSLPAHHRHEKLKAGALSLLVPGAGQLLINGDRSKGLVMLGVEAAIWGGYLVFDHQADGWADDYRQWAGLFAGTSGDHPDSYWRAVGRYADSDAYYEAQLREARAFGETAPPPPAAADAWQWRNATYQDRYQSLRASASKAYDRRDFMILFAILNRAVSAFDAVRNAGHDDGAGAVGTRVLGLDLALDMGPSLTRPEARCTLGRSF